MIFRQWLYTFQRPQCSRNAIAGSACTSVVDTARQNERMKETVMIPMSNLHSENGETFT